MKQTIQLGRLEAVHDAWKAAADHAESGAVRLLFTRGMKAVREDMVLFLAERDRLTIEFAVRDEAGNALPALDAANNPQPGRVQIADPSAYLAKLAELRALSVVVELPALSDDLLCRTNADAETLAILLDFIDVPTPPRQAAV